MTWKDLIVIRIIPTQPIHPKNVKPINAPTNLEGRSIRNFNVLIVSVYVNGEGFGKLAVQAIVDERLRQD
jgi:hypothetical protein